MRLTEAIELIKIHNQMVVDYQRNVIKTLAEMIRLNTANTKLSPIDAWVINVALTAHEPIIENHHRDDPYIHVHGIC